MTHILKQENTIRTMTESAGKYHPTEHATAIQVASSESLFKGDIAEEQPSSMEQVQQQHQQNDADGGSEKEAALPPPPSSSSSSSSSSNSKTSGHFHSFRLCMHRWPRTVAVLGKVCLLWTLILWALCFGFILSRVEGPSEIHTNDRIMAQRWLFKALPLREIFVAVTNLPTACMEKFVQEQLVGQRWSSVIAAANITNSSTLLVPGLMDPNATIDNQTLLGLEQIMENEFRRLEGLENLTMPQVPFLEDNATMEEVLKELHNYLQLCEESALFMIDYAYNAIQEIAEDRLNFSDGVVATDPLTFNWNRCWNNTELGNPNPWSPTPAQINASANQNFFFQRQWTRDQQRLAQQYLEERGCQRPTVNWTRDGCVLSAIVDSVTDATGGRDCATNTGSSAWFWFTVMTTVGYGNQSPVTLGGRALVGALAWLSIIVFAGIIVVSTNNWTAIAEDCFYRMNMRWLKRPIFSSVLWGVASVAWIAHIASNAREWWTERIPGYEVTKGDSYWFAYISTLTVGLGDFYLQPEGMYVSDVFIWSSVMLTGFVLVGTFLGKVGDLVTSWMPEQSESFGEYLMRTDFRTGKVIDPPQSKDLKLLRELAEEQEGIDNGTIKVKGEDLYSSRTLAPDGKTFNEHKIKMLHEKKQLLTKLLQDTEMEMEQRKAQASHHGESSSGGDV